MNTPTLFTRFHLNKSHNKGFTIVELLIVIIVIGVLSTIVLVSYSGVQQQAQNAKTVSALKTYADLLDTYRQKYGDFPRKPDGSSTDFVCLGTTYPSNTCMSIDSTVVQGAGIAYNNATFNASMQKIATSLPSASSQKVMIDGHPMVGAFVNLEPNSDQHISFYYVLAGNGAKCSDVAIIGERTEIARSSSGVFCGIDKVLKD